jgi:RNA polymerase sigma-70 factor (ECF subfamily)
MEKEKMTTETLTYLMEQFGTQMYVTAHRILKDSYLAEDAVQDALLLLARKEITRKEMTRKELEKLRLFVLMTTKRVAICFLRKRRKERHILKGKWLENKEKRSASYDNIKERTQKLEEKELYHLVGGLPFKYACPLTLKYKQEETNRQIAKDLNITEDALRKRLERGRKLLLEKLKKRHYF